MSSISHLHASLTPKANQTDTALHSSVCQTSMALGTCCQVRCADGPFESTARSYFRVTKSLEASSWLIQTVMDANHWERSESTQHRSAHGMETSSGSWTMATIRGSGCAPTWGLPLMIMMMPLCLNGCSVNCFWLIQFDVTLHLFADGLEHMWWRHDRNYWQN